MKFEEHFKHGENVDKNIVKDFETTGWIQWKGTDICIDIHCKCGHSSHVDDYFMYYFECKKCGTIYRPQTTIAFEEMTGDHLEYVKTHSKNVIRTDDSPEEL